MERAKEWGALLGSLVLLVFVVLWLVGGDPANALLRSIELVAGILAIFALVALTFALATLPAVIFHELGHYLAGKAVGYKFHTFVAGPLGLRAEGDRIVQYRVRPSRLHGFVVMVAPDAQNLLHRHFWFILGGPVASLLWTVLVFLVWHWSGMRLYIDLPADSGIGTYVASLLATYAVVATLLMLPGTLLPYRVRRMGGLPTDMLWLSILRRGGPPAERLVASMQIARLLSTGIASRDLPPALVVEAARLRDGTFEELTVQSVRWSHNLDRDPTVAQDAVERHREILAKLRSGLIEPWRTWALLTQATDAVFVQQDAETASQWIAEISKPENPRVRAGLAVVQAGIAALESSSNLKMRIDEAEREIDHADKLGGANWEWDRERLFNIRAGWPREIRIDAPQS